MTNATQTLAPLGKRQSEYFFVITFFAAQSCLIFEKKYPLQYPCA